MHLARGPQRDGRRRRPDRHRRRPGRRDELRSRPHEGRRQLRHVRQPLRAPREQHPGLRGRRMQVDVQRGLRRLRRRRGERLRDLARRRLEELRRLRPRLSRRNLHERYVPARRARADGGRTVRHDERCNDDLLGEPRVELDLGLREDGLPGRRTQGRDGHRNDVLRVLGRGQRLLQQQLRRARTTASSAACRSTR